MEGIRYRLRALRQRCRFDDPSEYVYIFNHIPKSGGTAFRHVLAQWSAIVSDYRAGVSEHETAAYINRKVDLYRVRRPAFVCGHYGLPGAYLHERYPEASSDLRFRLITIVRDPLELAISNYFYAKKTGQRVAAADLDMYLRHCDSKLAAVLNCASVIDDGEGALDAYWFIGLAERLPDSVKALSELLNKPYIEPPVMNATSRNEEPSEEALAIFRERNVADFDLYEVCVRQFERKYGPGPDLAFESVRRTLNGAPER